MAGTSKICFLIIGLPRSGTSSISQFLDHLGVYFGDPAHFLDPKKLTHNPAFYELQWVNEFNDSVITALSRPGAKPEDFLPLENDFNRPEIAPLRQSLECQLHQEFGDHAIIGVKDPRICFTYPLWHATLTATGYSVKTILTLRSSSAILKSNLELTPLNLPRWQRFHVRHLLAMRYFTREVPVCLFDYDALMRRPIEYGNEKAAELGLAVLNPAAATRHLSSKHYHHRPDEAGTGDPWVDQIDADLRAGRLEPEKYLTYRGAAILFNDELRELEQKEKLSREQALTSARTGAASPDQQAPGQPTMEQWFQEHQRLRALLLKGGRFDVKSRPDGSIDIRKISRS